jgi:cytochrome c-type biogenesis protein CcmF
MPAIGFYAQFGCLLLVLFAGAMACRQVFQGADQRLKWVEIAHTIFTGLLALASLILLWGLWTRDYSIKYVAEYTNDVLPDFYALTAFWAGQNGSLLFWAMMVALAGWVFSMTASYRRLDGDVKALYWAFFLVVEGFFLLLLTSWSNPFIALGHPPADGEGLNPLLQNPGMIFHPPLLFLGYALFTVPACLGLAHLALGRGDQWLSPARNHYILAWIFLTAGIILGGWWSYMELGWGGYWAWDPVENASLIPWLSGTAFLHTAVLQYRRQALVRSNVLLISLTLILCFFATYLVRSGVIDSLHAFGSGGVALPLLVFIFAWTGLTLWLVWRTPERRGRDLSGALNRQGALVLVSWVFLALGAIVLLGTMWPLISKLWSDNPVGLGPDFYNRVTPPLFTLAVLILAACPWLGWKAGLREKRGFWAAVAVVVLAGAGVFWAFGYAGVMPLLGAGVGAAVVAGSLLLAVLEPSWRTRRFLGVAGIHLGMGLVALGVAVSGPYATSREAILPPGGSLEMGAYTVEHRGLEQRREPGMLIAQAELSVTRDGEIVGTMRPQRRMYANFDQPFAEVSTIFSLGEELYAVLLGFDREGGVSLKFAVNPLINWIWIGGTIMCLAALACLSGPRREDK